MKIKLRFNCKINPICLLKKKQTKTIHLNYWLKSKIELKIKNGSS